MEVEPTRYIIITSFPHIHLHELKDNFIYLQRETQADYREAAHYRNLEIPTRRRPSILAGNMGSDYHAAHAAAQHPTAIDRDRYVHIEYRLYGPPLQVSLI